jgi:hypothetical protein
MAIIDGNLNLTDHQTLDSSMQMKTEVVTMDEPKDKAAALSENQNMNSLIAHVKGKYQRAKDQRRNDEDRWLLAYANYRGLYGSDVAFQDEEKSQAFMKITKTKVLAAYNQITEILFANNQFPIGIEPTKIPEGVAEMVNFDPKAPQDQAPIRNSTVSRQSILDDLGPLKEQLEPVKDKLKEGPGLTPTSFTFEPAAEAAKLMEKRILDQLEEARADKALRQFVFDKCLFGTGIFKGPFITKKEYPRWDESGAYTPVSETIPDVSHVSIWDAYPDPDARNMEEAEYFIQRHKLSRTQLRSLKLRPGFRKHSIEEVITQGSNYTKEYWEDSLRDGSDNTPSIDRFEVFEFWGILDPEMVKDEGIDIPDVFKDRDQIQVNVWICNDQILRCVLNQFTPARIPFFASPYELNPYSFFGIGIAENMEDTQLIMNGFMRLAIDNAALSSNIIFEVDESMLVPGQDMKLYPGKVFRRNGGQPGQSIFATKFPNVTQECMLLFDKARQLADEATGMPSYAHGVSGIQSTGRTAAGMSMLMGAAKENIKGVVRNIDDYLLVPLGKALFAFNMQFNFDKKYLGDVSVVARGTESLLRNEVRGQKLLQFLQIIGGNPAYAPYAKIDYILREIAISQDLDPDKTVNDPREAGIQAGIMGQMNQSMGVNPQQGNPNPAGAPNVSDPTGTGGGNIAPGMAPPPGAAGNTGAGGGSPQAADAAAQG